MSKKTFCYGGQARTIGCPCGFVAKGDVRTANFKMKLHTKVCDLASQLTYTKEFNRTNANMNGWKGMRGSEVVKTNAVEVVTDEKDIIHTTLPIKELNIIQKEKQEEKDRCDGCGRHDDFCRCGDFMGFGEN